MPPQAWSKAGPLQPGGEAGTKALTTSLVPREDTAPTPNTMVTTAAAGPSLKPGAQSFPCVCHVGPGHPMLWSQAVNKGWITCAGSLGILPAPAKPTAISSSIETHLQRRAQGSIHQSRPRATDASQTGPAGPPAAHESQHSRACPHVTGGHPRPTTSTDPSGSPARQRNPSRPAHSGFWDMTEVGLRAVS